MRRQIVDALCDRWKLTSEGREALEGFHDERLFLCLGISMGLGELFEDNAYAERAWLYEDYGNSTRLAVIVTGSPEISGIEDQLKLAREIA